MHKSRVKVKHYIPLLHLLKKIILVTNVVSEDKATYVLEVQECKLDQTLPEASCTTKLDHWWGTAFGTNKHSSLAKIVKALLSCFLGPPIEGSFSIMGNIMNSDSARLNVQTFRTILSIKDTPMASKKTATQYFHDE